MKKFILIFLFVNSFASFAQNNNMELAMEKAALKTDLYFCFKAALGNKLTNDLLIDSIIIKECDKQLNSADNLSITETEIREIVLEVIEENKKNNLEKAFEEFSRKHYNL